MSENLWPRNFGQLAVKPPVTILREQARALGERTANVVVGRVHTTPSSPGRFKHVMSLFCSPLSYLLEFLWIEHGVDLYPVDIVVFGEVDRTIRANSEEEFLARLGEVFAQEKTVTIIASLLAQSQE